MSRRLSLLVAALLIASHRSEIPAPRQAAIGLGLDLLVVAGTLAGPFFIETDEGPVPSGRVTCAASVRIDQATARQTGNGACTFTAQDGATAWGEWECAGYELVGCRGMFKLNGGTARLAGATGEGTMIWRPAAHELKKQLDGSALDNATGILLWREFKIKTK